VTLRAKVAVYLVAIHVALAALAVPLLWDGNRVWILLLEALVVLSLVLGLRLVRAIFVPLDLVRSGAQYLAESDFTVRFRETGQPDMDQLVEVYNRMADHLREERTVSEERHYFLEKILGATPTGVVILDYDEQIAVANPAACRMFRREPEALAGRRLSEVDDPLARSLAALGPDASRVETLWGSQRVRCRRSSFLDRGFERTFFLVDEMTEELRRTERAAYEKLIRVMSHEVNNTVTATTSLLDSCRTYAGQIGEEDRGDYESALEVVISRAGQLNAFMRGFAGVVRLPAPERRPADPLAILEGVERLMRAERERRRIAWAWEGEPIGRVSLDAVQLEQVFINVVKNALEAIGEDGTVTVRSGHADGRPFVALEDTGPAIPDDVRAELFTPFFSTKENGQGIGLTMVHEILSNHGFAFALEPLTPHGARFVVYF
jgi:two-component system nitrogen regulation sensor histidine kinase NtrY